MSARSQLVAATAPGAGRVLESRYPDWGIAIVDNGAPGNGGTARGGPASSPGWGTNNSGTGAVRIKNNEPGVGSGSAVGPNGAVSVQLLNAAAGDLADVKAPPLTGQLGQLAAGVLADPFERVFRFVGLLAFEPLPGALGAAADYGLELLPGNVASMNNGASRPGVMFGPTDAGTISLRTRQAFAGGYTSTQSFTLAQLGLASYNQWMLWELRVLFGDANGPAQLKAFLNGKQFGNAVQWGAAAGNLLPTYIGAGGGFYGLYPYLMNTNTGALSCYAQWLRVIRAPDETNA